MKSGSLLFTTSYWPWSPFPISPMQKGHSPKRHILYYEPVPNSIKASSPVKGTGPYMSLEVLQAFVCVSHPRNILPPHPLHHQAILHPPSGFQLRHRCFEKISLTPKTGLGALLMAFWSPWTCTNLDYTVLQLPVYCCYLSLDSKVLGADTVNVPLTVSYPI